MPTNLEIVIEAFDKALGEHQLPMTPRFWQHLREYLVEQDQFTKSLEKRVADLEAKDAKANGQNSKSSD